MDLTTLPLNERVARIEKNTAEDSKYRYYDDMSGADKRAAMTRDALNELVWEAVMADLKSHGHRGGIWMESGAECSNGGGE